MASGKLQQQLRLVLQLHHVRQKGSSLVLAKTRFHHSWKRKRTAGAPGLASIFHPANEAWRAWRWGLEGLEGLEGGPGRPGGSLQSAFPSEDRHQQRMLLLPVCTNKACHWVAPPSGEIRVNGSAEVNPGHGFVSGSSQLEPALPDLHRSRKQPADESSGLVGGRSQAEHPGEKSPRMCLLSSVHSGNCGGRAEEDGCPPTCDLRLRSSAFKSPLPDPPAQSSGSMEERVGAAAALLLIAFVSHGELILLLFLLSLLFTSVNASIASLGASRWGHHRRQGGGAAFSALHGVHPGARGRGPEARVRRLRGGGGVGDDGGALPAHGVRAPPARNESFLAQTPPGGGRGLTRVGCFQAGGTEGGAGGPLPEPGGGHQAVLRHRGAPQPPGLQPAQLRQRHRSDQSECSALRPR